MVSLTKSIFRNRSCSGLSVARHSPLVTRHIPSVSPLELTLTKNVHVSALESTLAKYKDLKSHRIILLQKRVGGRLLASKPPQVQGTRSGEPRCRTFGAASEPLLFLALSEGEDRRRRPAGLARVARQIAAPIFAVVLAASSSGPGGELPAQTQPAERDPKVPDNECDLCRSPNWP